MIDDAWNDDATLMLQLLLQMRINKEYDGERK